MLSLKRGGVSVLTAVAVCVAAPMIPLILSRVVPDASKAPAPVCDHFAAESFFLDDDGKWKCVICRRPLPSTC